MNAWRRWSRIILSAIAVALIALTNTNIALAQPVAPAVESDHSPSPSPSKRAQDGSEDFFVHLPLIVRNYLSLAPEEIIIEPDVGGEIASLNQEVTITFHPNGLPKAIVVAVREDETVLPPNFMLVGPQVRVVGRWLDSNEPVTLLDPEAQPITDPGGGKPHPPPSRYWATVSVRLSDLLVGDDRVVIARQDPLHGKWEILPTQLDTEAKLATAETDRLGGFALIVNAAQRSDHSLSTSRSVNVLADIGDEFTVDDLDAGFVRYEYDGSLTYWWDVNCGTGGCWLSHAWYTYNRSDFEPLPLDEPWNWATWTPNLPESGYYYVKAWIPSADATTQGAEYEIHHDGAVDTIAINQLAISADWALLGSYHFTAGGGEHIYLDDVVPEQGQNGSRIGFDAVKFVYAGQDQPPADTTPPEIDLLEVWENGEGALSTQARITDDSGTIAFYEMIVNPSSGGQIGQPLAPFPSSDFGSGVYAGTIVDIPSAELVQFTIIAQDPSGNTTYAHADSDGRVWYSHVLGDGSDAGTCGNPVNSSLGEKSETAQDLTVPGRSETDIHIRRTYHSQTDYVGPFGKGWSFTYDYLLEEVNNPLLDGVHVRHPDGHTVNYQHDGSGRYNSISPGSYEYVLREGDGYALHTPEQTAYHLDGDGHLTRIVNAKGGEITLTYDGSGHLSTVTNESDRTVTLGFTGERIASLTVASKTLTYQYQGEYLKKFVDANGGEWTYDYDGNGFLSQVWTPEGHSRNTQTYDERGEVQSQTLGDSRTLDFEFDRDNRRTIVRDVWNNPTTHTYDDHYRLVRAESALGHAETFEYDDDNLIEHVDQAGFAWRYGYDANGNLIYRADPVDGTSYGGVDETFWLYDEQNRVVSTTNSLGYTTLYDYDTRGNLLHIYYPDGSVITNTYYGDGQLQSRTDPLGNTTRYYYYPITGDLWKVVDPLGNETTYEYDELGRKTAEIDALGNRTTYRYDGRDQLVAITDPSGNTTRHQYDGDGRRTDVWDRNDGHTHYEYSTCCGLLTRVVDAEGGVTEYGYNEMNQRTWMRDPNGNVTEYRYDEDYRLVEEIAPPATPGGKRGRTTYFYDPRGNLIQTNDPLGNVTRYVYDADNRLKQTIDAEGNVTENCYDTEDRLVARFDPRRAETQIVYDAMGRQIQTIDPLGNVSITIHDLAGRRIAAVEPHDADAGKVYTTTYRYDAAGRLTATTDPLGNVTYYEYDALGHTVAITDANGNVTRKEYDENDRLVTVVDALGGATRYDYDPEGQQTVVTDTLGNVTYYSYDLLGRTTVITGPMGQITCQGYDANGNLITVTNALSAATVYGYDGLDRRVWERDPLDLATTYEYDLVGNQTAITDAAGRLTRYSYDGLGRLLSVTDATSGTTRYEYDEVGNTTVVTDVNGYATTYAYNFLDQLTRKTNPLDKSWWYSYDDAGHLIREVNGEWQAATYEYDGAGRRTAIIYGSAGERVDFEYDAVGNRVAVTDATGVTTYVYNALKQPLTVTSPFTGVVGYHYDAMGNRTQTIYPDSKVVAYTYDAASRLASVTDWAGQTATYEYDVAGQLVTETLPNGVRTVSVYDAAGRLTRITHRRLDDDEILGNHRFVLDKVGNRVVVTETLVVLTETLPITTVIHYTYDPLNRPTRVNHSSGERFAYVYDLAGNVLTYTRTTAGQDVATSYTYDAANQLVTAEASDDPITWLYTYDANGNLTEITPNGLAPDNGARRYTYNRADRLIRVETHDGTAYWPRAEMMYNGLGQRVSLTAWTAGLSLTTHYVLDPLYEARPLAAAAAGRTTFYVHGHGPLAELTDGWSYYLTDGNRTVRQLSEADGSITLVRSYTPWGELLEQHGGGDLTWGYFGGLLDAATGLIYVGEGQYYDPETGRFLSPIGGRRNPYVPASPGDPLGALLGPVALVALLARRRRKEKQDGWWMGLVLVLVVGVSVGLTACGSGTPTPPVPSEEEDTPTPPSESPEPGPTPTRPKPEPTSTEMPPTPTPTCTPTPTPTPYPPDPEYELDETGSVDWNAYWAVANEYARSRTAQYTAEEILFAKAIWSEEREQDIEFAAINRAMTAIGYLIRHRRDESQGWFGATNTIQAVVEDTRSGIQFQAYWAWEDRDVVEDYLVRKEEVGQPGLGFESDDRILWFDSLDIARQVLQGSATDPMTDSVGFGHGDAMRQSMEARKAVLEQDSELRKSAVLGGNAEKELVIMNIAGTALWICNFSY